jgi:hypothetical protein
MLFNPLLRGMCVAQGFAFTESEVGKELPAGRYIVLPSTFDNGKLGTFVIKLFVKVGDPVRACCKPLPREQYITGCNAGQCIRSSPVRSRPVYP